MCIISVMWTGPLDFPLPRPFSLRSSSSSTRGGGSATSQGSKLRWRRQAHRATASSGPSKVIALGTGGKNGGEGKWVLVQLCITVCWCLCLTHNKLILDLGLEMLEWVNQVVNITIKCVQCSPADWLRSCSQCCWLPKNHLSAEDDTSFGDVQKKDGCSAFRIKAHMQPDHPPHCTYQHILLSPFETLYLWGTSHVVTVLSHAGSQSAPPHTIPCIHTPSTQTHPATAILYKFTDLLGEKPMPKQNKQMMICDVQGPSRPTWGSCTSIFTSGTVRDSSGANSLQRSAGKSNRTSSKNL